MIILHSTTAIPQKTISPQKIPAKTPTQNHNLNEHILKTFSYLSQEKSQSIDYDFLMVATDIDELNRLRAENARLRALLASHGIVADSPKPSLPQKPKLSLEEKVNLFRSLFHGREDVFARRWFSASRQKWLSAGVCS